MLVAEQLFLLLRRDDGRPESGSGYEGYGLVGAVLTDLVAAGHVTMSDDVDPIVGVVATGAVGHRVLDTFLDRLRTTKNPTVMHLVLDTRLNPHQSVVDSLVEAGVVTVRAKRALGFVPARYPVRDPAPERALRERLRAVLAGATPQPNEAALLALLKGMSIAAHILTEETGTLSRRDLDRRIAEVSAHAVVGTAVGAAIEQLQSAVMVAGGS